MVLLRLTASQAMEVLAAVEQRWLPDEPDSDPVNRRVATLHRSVARQLRQQGVQVSDANGPDGRPT